jgi:hypothetical protein
VPALRIKKSTQIKTGKSVAPPHHHAAAGVVSFKSVVYLYILTMRSKNE